MIAFGTGGDEDSHFETLKDMFYNPDGYNCLGFKNIWDETPSDKLCGFFIPQYTNMDFRDENGKRVYMDDDGRWRAYYGSDTFTDGHQVIEWVYVHEAFKNKN